MKNKNIKKDLNIAAGQFIQEKEYWMDKLSTAPGSSYFLYDYNKEKGMQGEKNLSECMEFRLDQTLFTRLMGLSSGSASKLHMVLTAAVFLLLNKYTGNKDIIAGTSIDKQEEDEGLINTILPLRIKITDNMTFKELLLQTRETVNEAIKNQNYPIETLFPCQQGTGGQGEMEFPLYDVSVILENIQDKQYIKHLDNSVIFSFLKTDEYIKGTVDYRADRYRRESIERIVNYLTYLLQETLFNVDRNLANITMLSGEDKKRLDEFNNTCIDYPLDKTIPGLFEEQALTTPDNIAIEEVTGNFSMSYRELNNRASLLAEGLREKGVAPGGIIGIYMERSLEFVIAILGVLKAGGVYLPIDTDYPPDRLAYMLKDSAAKILLSTPTFAKNVEKLKNLAIETIFIEKATQSTGGMAPASNPPAPVSGFSAAYVIYTSGSTGKPKGVMIQQGAVVNYILWAAENYVKNERVKFPLFTSIAFDLTVTSIFTPLLTGNTVVIYKDALMDEIVNGNRVDVVKLTPAHLNLVRSMNTNKKKKEGEKAVKSHIKRFILGGEQLDTRLVREIFDDFYGNIEIYNEYGPTEATVGCMIYQFDPQKINSSSVPIGTPAGNFRIYLLDKKLNPTPVPPGAAGEIYISGAGLARGYLNRPELTAKKFIFYEGDSPLLLTTQQTASNHSPNHLYRTGDLGRWLPDGNIEFLGRIDDQVKIRGFRIELGEIESCLFAHEDIRQVVVIERNGTGSSDVETETDKHLCAYITGDKKLTVEGLREYLSGKLPAYMLPSYFVQLETIPLTSNGKLDRKSLPQPKPSERAVRRVEYRPPTSELEKILVEIWRDVLGVDRIGLDDSYFSLGGDSIGAVRISARLHKYKLKLDLKYLYQYPTIGQLAFYVESMNKMPFQGIVQGEVKLTPIHQWFFEKNFTEEHRFNQAVILHREGEKGFDEDIVRKVFDKLVEHHDALRMIFRYEEEDKQIKQENRGFFAGMAEPEVYDITGETGFERVIKEKAQAVERKMDLSKGPLLKSVLFKSQKGDYLLIVIHHLVIDGVSWRILFEDFASFYKQMAEGRQYENMEIPLKTTSFREWAEMLYEYSNSSELLKEIPYWQGIEQAEVLPLHPPGVRDKETETVAEQTLLLSQEYTGKLLKEVNKAYNTEINDILLAALGLALSDWTGNDKFFVDLEGHGREEILEDVNISRTVGWFTTIYPVVLDVKRRSHLPAVIKNTKEMLRRIPNKGIGFGILKYLTQPGNKGGLKFRLQPEIGFNYLGQFDEDVNFDLFRLADISTGDFTGGEMRKIYDLYVSGLIFNYRLRIALNYNKGKYSEKTISTFMEGYEKSLQQIIDHCLEQEETELTLSDFSSSVAEQEAEEIFDVLSEIVLEN